VLRCLRLVIKVLYGVLLLLLLLFLFLNMPNSVSFSLLLLLQVRLRSAEMCSSSSLRGSTHGAWTWPACRNNGEDQQQQQQTHDLQAGVTPHASHC
jgi:hypothetical protein